MDKNELLSRIELANDVLFGLFGTEFKKDFFSEKEFSRISNSILHLENQEEIGVLILYKILKKNLNLKINISEYLAKKEFEEIKNLFVVTRKEFEDIFLKIKIELHEEYLNSPEVKKIILEVRGELPIISARIYNISLGLLTRADGSEVSLKNYSELTGESLQTNLKILEVAKKIIEKKVARKLEQINA